MSKQSLEFESLSSLLLFQAKFEATLATETLLTSEEAVIAAAAAEAVTLAKAAVKVAKDAALLVRPSTRAESISLVSSEARNIKTAQAASRVRDSLRAEMALLEDRPPKDAAKESDDLQPTNEELRILQEQLSKSIAVRSRRQSERKAKRDRAAEKAAANVVAVKSGSNSRKKRASVQDVDHSDPLRYLRSTTSTSRLLTATEEIELSEGIQVWLKLSIINL